MFEEEQHPESPALSQRSRIGVILLALLCIVTIGYAWHQRSVAANLAGQNDQIAAALKDTRGQIDALTAKMNALTAAQAAQTPPVEAPAASPRRTSRQANSRHVRRDDPRWKKVQAQLDAQGKAIESTQQDLNSAKTELSGSIARTHGELVALQRKGERNYYEFDLDKSKEFAHKGPVGIRVRKANTKNQYADLELLVDDVKLTQKHVNLYQPVVFYAAEGQRPIELVVNSVRKNHIHGYVSEPKYKQSELAAVAAGADNANASQPANASTTNSPDAAANTPPQPRQRLQLH